MRALVKVRPKTAYLMACSSIGDMWCEYAKAEVI
jgi:hypothetical protein